MGLDWYQGVQRHSRTAPNKIGAHQMANEQVPSVRDVMTESRYTIRQDVPAYEGVDFLVDKKLFGVPVVDADRNLVGFLTEKDALRLQAVAHQYNMTGSTVKDIMSEIKNPLRPDMDLLSASMQFLSCNFGSLPVMEGDQLVGTLSRQGMLQAIRNMNRTKGRAKENGKHAQRIQDNPTSIFELQALVARSNRAQLASVFGNRHSKS